MHLRFRRALKACAEGLVAGPTGSRRSASGRPSPGKDRGEDSLPGAVLTLLLLTLLLLTLRLILPLTLTLHLLLSLLFALTLRLLMSLAIVVPPAHLLLSGVLPLPALTLILAGPARPVADALTQP